MFVSLYFNISSLFLEVDFPLPLGILSLANDSSGVRTSVVFSQNTKGAAYRLPIVYRGFAPARIYGHGIHSTGSQLFNCQATHGSQVLAWPAHHGQGGYRLPARCMSYERGRGSHSVPPSCLHPYSIMDCP